jgi:hypothetical protein
LFVIERKIKMFTKKERISTWVILAGLSILLGGSIELLAESYFPDTGFHRIASFMFASGAVLGVVGVSLAFLSLAINDMQESKNTETFVNLGRHNDRIISVHKLRDAILHLPVAGTVHQTIIAPSKTDVPYVAGETLEHIHFGSGIPKVEVMNDELYQKLFGPLDE